MKPNLSNEITMKLSAQPELFKEDNLLKRFEEIHNYIYANDGLSAQQTLEEIIKILFIKIYDEKIDNNEFYISPNETETVEKTGSSWKLQNRILLLFEKTKRQFSEVFDTDDKIRLSDLSLAFAVATLQSISLSNSSSDVKGLAFQKILTHNEKNSGGQFFTPEPVINFCVDIIQPKPFELIADPACGSGGFLFSSLNYITKSYKNTTAENIITNNLFGLDINKNTARMAKMKMLLESNTKVNVSCANSLGSLDKTFQIIADIKNKSFFDGFDVIITNPPFGGKINNRKTLAQYNLGYKWAISSNEFYKTNTISNTQSIEVLFIERCLQLLKKGGRMGIVLPNGHFENPSLEYVRHFIKKKAIISAIVKLPQETFIPYGTGMKTSLLFLKKNADYNSTKHSVFFSKIKKLGYQGNKNGTPVYKKDKYGMNLKNKKGSLLLDEDFSVAVKEYKKFQKYHTIETDISFSVKLENLKGRFDYDFYSPENRKIILSLENNKSVRLGEIAEIVKLKSKKLNNSDGNVKYVELSDVNTHLLAIINSTIHQVHNLPSRASYELKEGNIITAIAGNSVGTKKHATALVTEEHEGSICTNGFRVLDSFKIDRYYLLHFLQSEMFLKQMYMYRTGAAIPNVSDTDLLSILIDLPDSKTIKKISNAVKKALELSKKSRKILQDIQLKEKEKFPQMFYY